MKPQSKAEEVAKELAKKGIDPDAPVPEGIPEPETAKKNVVVPTEHVNKDGKKTKITVVWN